MKRKEKHMELGQNLGGMCAIAGLKEKNVRYSCISSTLLNSSLNVCLAYNLIPCFRYQL